MSMGASLRDALADGVPFVGIMVFWIVVTALVYGPFVALWPETPEVNPWVHLGVYLFPLVGYLGHVLGQAR